MRLERIGLLLAGCACWIFAATANAQVIDAALTNTSQLGSGLPGKTLAAVNFRFATQAPSLSGSVNGFTFQDVLWTSPVTPLAGGGTISIAPILAGRDRFQSTTATISGAGETILESVADTINFLGSGEQETFNLAGLPANQDVFIQLIGGDAGNLGPGANNWLGDLQISVNGNVVGVWDDVADDELNTASIASFVGRTDIAGNLSINALELNPQGGPFVGIAGLIITTTPEPATWIAMLLMAPAMAVGYRVLRRRQRSAAKSPAKSICHEHARLRAAQSAN